MSFTINSLQNKENPTKNVLYFGHEFTVPEWVKYLATDPDGSLMGYEIIPVVREHMDRWDSETGPIEMIAKLDFTGDWRDSLVEV